MSSKDRHASGVIRLSPLLDAKVREIAEMTRQPISQTLNMLVLYALDNVEVKPVKVYEMKFKECK